MSDFNENMEFPVQQKKKSKALPVIAVIVVIAVTVGLILGIGGKGGSGLNPIFYMEDNALYMKNINNAKAEAVKICDVDETYDYGADISINSENTEIYFTISEQDESPSIDDGDEFIFYEMGDYSTLYRYSLTDSEAVPVKVAEKVIDYAYDETSSTFYCLIGEDSTLTEIDANGTNEIAPYIYSFTLSADGQSVVFETDDGSVGLRKKDADIISLSENATLVYSDPDFSFFYIIEDEYLYKVTANSRELIDSGVTSASFNGADGYYFKETATWLLKDLFDDDMAEADNEIKIPTDDSDENAYDIYTQRLARDEIRSYVLDPEFVFSVQDVYYFDGSESKKMLENALNADLSEVTGKEYESVTGIFCTVVDTDKIEKIRMSEIWAMLEDIETSDDYAYSFISEAYDLFTNPFVNSSTDYFICKGDFAAATGINALVNDVIFDEEDNVLYITAYNEDKYSLYRFAVTENGLGEAELVKESISIYDLHLTEDGKLIYLEEITSGEHDSYYNIYLDSQLIEENVSSLSEYDFETETLTYDVYCLDENGEIDFEGSTVQIYYDLESGTKTELKADSYYYSYFSTSENIILLEEVEDGETYTVYTLENGELTNTGITVPYPESYYPVSEYRNCYNFTTEEYF